MYLTRSLSWHGQRCDMVGVIPADTVMHTRPQGRGYVRLAETTDMPWQGGVRDVEVHAHEFHYSALENLNGDFRYAYEVKRGTGIDGRHDGLIYRNLLASYTHLRDVEGNHWVRRFVDFVRRHRHH